MSRPALHLTAIFLGMALFFACDSVYSKEETHTPLGEQMESIAKNIRTLRRQISDPGKKESSLALLDAVEKNALKARAIVPAKTKDVPEADREKFVAAYQSKIDELVEAIRKTAGYVREGHFDQAKEELGKLQALKRKGHEEFSAEKDEE